ncbi:MAG TPA: methyltransferase [Dehalococcoidia bacterium]|nr:methyltransferase [Dehalococcoidia bacterium]
MGTKKEARTTDNDVYFKKLLPLRIAGHNLNFRVSQDLFSSHQVDSGTRFLLKTIIANDYGPLRKVLDLGCGYGPIGLSLNKAYADSSVHMVDRDALAVEYTRRNTELNGLCNTSTYGSLDYDNVSTTDFDLIACNIPGKAGESVISHLLMGAADYLVPDGMVAIVVVSALETMVEKLLATTPGINIIFRGNHSGHAVYHYRFTKKKTAGSITAASALESGVYDRTRATFSFRGLEYAMRTAWGLPDFDSRSYRTGLLLEGIQESRNKDINRALVFNPGQGHAPVVLAGLLKPDHITLVDRDLLSLRYSETNLTLNNYPAGQVTTSHQAGIMLEGDEQADIIIGTLREDEGTRALTLTVGQATEQLSPGGLLLLSGGSTAVTRLTDVIQTGKQYVIQGRRRKKGYSLLALKLR